MESSGLPKDVLNVINNNHSFITINVNCGHDQCEGEFLGTCSDEGCDDFCSGIFLIIKCPGLTININMLPPIKHVKGIHGTYSDSSTTSVDGLDENGLNEIVKLKELIKNMSDSNLDNIKYERNSYNGYFGITINDKIFIYYKNWDVPIITLELYAMPQLINALNKYVNILEQYVNML